MRAPRLVVFAAALLCVRTGRVSAQIPVPPPPPLPSIDGAPFLRFAPSFSLTQGNAQGWFTFEAGLRPPQESFGVTTRLRATHVIGSFQPAALLTLFGGLERYAPGYSFHTLGGFGTATNQGWNVLALEAGLRVSRFRLDLRTTRSVGGGETFVIDTLAPEATGGRSVGPFAYADAELQWEVPLRGFEFLVAVGGRAGSSRTASETWSYASLALPLPVWSRRVAAVGTLGRRPSVPELGVPGGRFAGLGFRLTLDGASAARKSAPSPRASDAGSLELVRVAESDRYELKLRVPANMSVQVRGDFTDWMPVELARARDGAWSTMLGVRPGIYQIEMRLDAGSWTAPPGVVLVPDGFGGKVGVLEVR